jgi:hypothetical protein
MGAALGESLDAGEGWPTVGRTFGLEDMARSESLPSGIPPGSVRERSAIAIVPVTIETLEKTGRLPNWS